MFQPTRIAIPTLVRVKEGALDRVGIYLVREEHTKIAVLISHGMVPAIQDRLKRSLEANSVEIASWSEVAENDWESAQRLAIELSSSVSAVVGTGGGKALDVAKYAAYLFRLPYYAVPTSLSNDGFSSPQSSLTVQGKRRSLPAALPRGVIIDTGVCREAPRNLTLSGVGDLVAKLTAVRDWKLAFHATGEAVDDFAALISESSLHAFRSHPAFDLEGIRLLATGLLMSGIAMEIAGSSRPASGSEHLISHALDAISSRPRLHGLQVGVASHLVSLLQGENTGIIAELFDVTGFWDAIADDPFSRSEWREALRVAPTMKDFYTILSDPKHLKEAERLLMDDPRLVRCFGDE
jgi:glycerol-1-phosphate dehydrogenase [NAD(P)+]